MGPCVRTTKSGLQYRVIREGSGVNHPVAQSTITCMYEGRNVYQWPAGRPFAVARRPTPFRMTRMIKGWYEALSMMVDGDKWEIYLSSDLATGSRVPAAMISRGGTAVVYTIELVSIRGRRTLANRTGAAGVLANRTGAAGAHWAVIKNCSIPFSS